MKGSVIKRGKKWTAILYLGRENGKDKQKWVSGFKSKKEAENALPDLLKKAQSGQLAIHNDSKASEFLDMWLEDHVKPNTAAGTYDKYRAAAKSAGKSFGNVKTEKLTPTHIQKWVNQLSKSKLKKSTIKSYYKSIQSAFSKGINWRIVSQSPFVGISLPQDRKRPMATLSSPEVSRLLLAARNHPIYLVILLAASCGMRRGEILGLRWRQVDLTTKMFYLSENYTQSSSGAFLSELKTASSYRSVDFNESIHRALLQQKAAQLNTLRDGKVIDLDKAGEDALLDLHVCTWEDLRPMNPGYVSRKHKELIQKAGVTPCRFHDLRHTHASLLLQNGVHPKVVQERLGHSKISVTLDTYSHLIPTMQREAAQLLHF